MTAPGGGLLAGRRAFVTGGARGLGFAIVEALAAAGASGVSFDLEPSPAMPKGWRAETGDVCDETALSGAIAGADALDIVVANAGIVPPWVRTADIELQDWRRAFAVNVDGVMLTVKHAARAMARNGGSIILMASLNGRRAHGRQAAYTATKHAVIGLTRAAALDLGRDGIRVNALAPGPIATEALLGRVAERAAAGTASAAETLANYAGQTAFRRLATAAEVAAACVFLAGDLSAGITGQVLPVDAGLP